MNYLTKKQILDINKYQVKEYGGNFVPPSNLLNEDRLDYLLDIVKSEMFEQHLYPEIYHKAGVYMFNIICNHVFQDGNKRTGLKSSLMFILLNDYQLSRLISNQSLIDFVTEVASGHHTLETVQDWFKNNIIKI